MAKEIKTAIQIKATPEKVWSILSNFSSYPIWNPFIKFIKGDVKVGNKITVTIEQTEGNRMTFKPTILAIEPNKQLKWIGHFIFKGLFDGEHKFELIDNLNGTTKFIQSENFKGILVPFFKNQLENNTTKGFNNMNEILKELAEQKYIFL